jgi:hypothetical protein
MQVLAFLSLFALGSTLVAQAGSAAPPTAKPALPPSASKPDLRPTFTPEREAAALAFVSAHHPELLKVLEQLKGMQLGEYESAIRQLFQTSEQLSRTKDQDEARYLLDLEEWKIKSRIQLLVARAGLSEDESQDQQLHDLLSKQADLRLARINLERDRATERLKKVEDQLAKVKTDRDAEVEKQFTNLMRSVNKARAEFRKKNGSSNSTKSEKQKPQ